MPLEAIGGGLTSRMIFIYGSGKGHKEVIPVGDPELEKHLLGELEQIFLMAGEFKVTKSFMDTYSKWYLTSSDSPLSDPKFSGYVERRANHILKLSMIMSASRGRSMQIEVEDLDRALDILYKAEDRMPQVFLGVGRNPHAEVSTRLSATLATTGKIDWAAALTRYHNDLTATDFEGVVSGLVQMGVCQVTFVDGKKYIIYTGEQVKEVTE
jgi:hypothetical protein